MDAKLQEALRDWIKDALPFYRQRELQLSNKLYEATTRGKPRSGVESLRRELYLLRAFIRNGENLLKQLDTPLDILPAKRRKTTLLLEDQEENGLVEEPKTVEEPLVRAPKGLSFEQRLVLTFNESGASITAEFDMEPFGVANLTALHRGAFEEPDFQVMEGGMYRLVRDGAQAYVVPRPSLQLDDARYRSGGIAHLFECPGFERDSYWSPIRLVRPASVLDQGGRWQVVNKGELKDGSA
jgi:hypothetical protein